MVRTVLAAVVAAVLVAGAAAVAVTSEEGPPRLKPGPMTKPQPHVWGMVIAPGKPFTDGLEEIVVRGDEPAKITKIEVDADEGLKTLGFKLVLPGRKYGGIQRMYGWPPRYKDLDQSLVTDVEGTQIRTLKQTNNDSYELLIGHRVDQEGYFVRDGFWITYEVDGQRYRQYFPAVLTVCAGEKYKGMRDCPPPDDW
jgi:hypothetical protein